MEVNDEPVTPVVVGVDMQVIDYYVVTEADSYDKHYFIIQIQAEDVRYTVDRSYVDFVELDRLLKKLHPDSAVPHLPLRAAPVIEKFLAKEAAKQQEQNNMSGSGFGFGRNSFSLTRDSLLASPSFKSSGIQNASVLKIPENSTEIIRNRMGPLTLYLTGIACYHELLTSYPLRNFLDEEYTSMLDLTIPPSLTEFDLLLLNSPVQTCVVHRVEQHNVEVPANHFLLWRFRTTKYDIGFSIDVNGKTRLPLTRYRSSEQSICGAIILAENSMLTLKWNNTYAKLHSKSLSWSIRVVNKIDFEAAKQQALECEEEKIRFSEQRYALQRASIRHAATLSGIIHGSMIQAEYHETRNFATKSFQENTTDLSQQREVLVQDLEKAEETIELLESKVLDLEQSKISLEQSKKIVSDSWIFTTQQLEAVKKELDELRIYLADLENTTEQQDREITLLHQETERKDQLAEQSSQAISTILHNVQLLIEHYNKLILDHQGLVSQREEELNHTLKNDDEASEGVSQESAMMKKEARFETLLLLTQDLLDDLSNSLSTDQEAVALLLRISEDLSKLLNTSEENKVDGNAEILLHEDSPEFSDSLPMRGQKKLQPSTSQQQGVTPSSLPFPPQQTITPTFSSQSNPNPPRPFIQSSLDDF